MTAAVAAAALVLAPACHDPSGLRIKFVDTAGALPYGDLRLMVWAKSDEGGVWELMNGKEGIPPGYIPIHTGYTLFLRAGDTYGTQVILHAYACEGDARAFQCAMLLDFDAKETEATFDLGACDDAALTDSLTSGQIAMTDCSPVAPEDGSSDADAPDEPDGDDGLDVPPDDGPGCHPAQMQVAAHSPLYPGDAVRIEATDDLIFVATRYSGLDVLRTADMARLKRFEPGSAELGGYARDLHVFGGKLYIAVEGTGGSGVVREWSIDPSTGDLVSTADFYATDATAAVAVFVDGGGVYALLKNRMSNILYLESPRRMIQFDGCGEGDLLVIGSTAWFTCAYVLFGIDLDNGLIPSEIDYDQCEDLPFCHNVNCGGEYLLSYGRYIYVGYPESCMGGPAMDVIDPGDIKNEVFTAQFMNKIWGFEGAMNYLFAATSDKAVLPIDISDPAHPRGTDLFALARDDFRIIGKVSDLSILDTTAYAAYNLDSPTADEGWGIARIDLACY